MSNSFHIGTHRCIAKMVLTALLMSLIISCSAFAGDISRDELALSDEVFTIVVTASRIPQIITETPASVVVITKEQLEQAGVSSLDEALKTVSGLYVKGYGYLGGTSSMLLRGSSREQTLVLLDGRPLNDAQSGGVDASSIPLQGVERIEVIKGAASALYGADAVAGVINIITAAGKAEPSHTLRLDVGEYGTRFLTFTSTGGSELTGYTLTATNLSTEGFQEHSTYETLGFHLRLDHEMSSTDQIAMGIRHSDYYTEDPKFFSIREDKDTSLDLQYNRVLNLSSDLTLKAYLDNAQIQYGFGSLHKLQRTGWDLQVNTAPAGSQHLFTYGIAGERNWVDSNNFPEPKERTSWGIYAQDIYSLTPRFDVVISGRFDQFSSHGDSLCGRVGLNYLLGDRTKLYASWGNAFRAPTLNELYWHEEYYDETGNLAGATYGDPDLKPEIAQNYELGWQHWLDNGTNFSAAVFHRNITNMIRWLSMAIDPDNEVYALSAINIDNVEVQGIELEAAYRLAAPLTAHFNYTYLDAVKNENQPLDYTPSHKAQASLTYTSEHGFSGTVETLYVGERFDSLARRAVPAYTVTNLNLNQKIGSDWQLHCQVSNVFNTKYEDTANYPAPPRMISAGVSYSF